MVDVRPLKARVGAVSPVLFKNGEGCGACYKVKCTDDGICSRRPVTIIVTDECPGGYCANGRFHFDLSGAAFSRMAVAGLGSRLRDRGEIQVQFRRYGNSSAPSIASLSFACSSAPFSLAVLETRSSFSFYLYLRSASRVPADA